MYTTTFGKGVWGVGYALLAVFTSHGASGEILHESAKLLASDAAAGDQSGYRVSLSGDTAVVGALHHDGAGTDSGSAYVHIRTGGAWPEQQKLTASDAAADDSFGISVAVSGDTAVAGLRATTTRAGWTPARRTSSSALTASGPSSRS